MTLPKYGQYRDSAVPWLGAVPRHWFVGRLKHFIERNDGGVWGSDPDDQSDTIVLRSTEQTVDGHWQLENPAKRKLTDKEKESAFLDFGDLLITKSSGSTQHIGKTSLVDAHIAAMGCCYSNFMQRIRVCEDLLPKLAWYVLNSRLARVQFDVLSNSTTGLANINGTMIGDLVLAVPPVDEQTAIVNFLDRETTKIDALIAEQEMLITLLAEKRQATISHAVTRGLNPDVPMKDSGVAWLGEVPTHWHISPLKHLVSLRSGGTPSKENVDYWNGDIPWASAKDLKSEQLFDTVDHITTLAVESGNASLVPVGTVLIVVRGMILARTFPVAQALVPMAINQDLKGITPKQSLYAQFLAWLLRGTADESLRRLDEAGHGTKALRMDAWTSMQLPVPPVDEQSVITDFLEQETAKLDSLVASALRAIDLLKERRASFITAAVTGQIDVRGEVAAQTSTEEAATA